MDYDQALKEAQRVGARLAQGEAHLAQMCHLLQFKHGAVSPKLVFEGAVKKGIDGNTVMKLSDDEIIDLMFE